MTLRHGVSAALLFLAGVGWAVNPPPGKKTVEWIDSDFKKP